MIINDSLNVKDKQYRNIEEEWKTIRGTHVDVDDEGNITKGPDALKKKFNKLSDKDQKEYESKPSSSNYSSNKRLNTKLVNYRNSMDNEEDKESFDYLMASADDNLKNFIGQWCKKADNEIALQDGEKIKKVSHDDDKDTFYFLIPGNNDTALSKSRYSNFDNNRVKSYGDTTKQTLSSTDSTGDIELTLYHYNSKRGGSLIKIDKYI